MTGAHSGGDRRQWPRVVLDARVVLTVPGIDDAARRSLPRLVSAIDISAELTG